jgi:hypothetical protein
MKKTAILLTATILALSSAGCAQLDQDIETFTVESKDRECNSDGETVTCRYVVLATDGRAYTNEDDLLNGKFNSRTFQARLQVGQTYTVRTTGWRIPFLSMSPNIVEIISPTPLKGKAL